MNRVIKINSNQGGNFSASNNLIDFRIPDDGVYDLSKSYINIVSNCVQTSARDGFDGGNGVYVPLIGFLQDDGTTANPNVMPNVALIKNCSMRNSNVGVIEDIRRCDILRTNLQAYTLSDNDKMTAQRKQLVQTFTKSRNKNSIYRELHKEGSDESRNIEAHIRIELKDIFNFGSISAYDTQKYGKTDIHLECNFDKLSVSQYLPNNATWSGDNDLIKKNLGVDITGPNVLGSDRRHIILGTGNTTNQTKYNRLDDCQFWVGQKVSVTLTHSLGNGPAGNRFTAGVANIPKRIVEIYYNRGDNNVNFPGVNVGNICIVLDSALDTTAGIGPMGTTETITNITMLGVNTTANTLTFDTAELVLEKVVNPPKIQYPIKYTSWTTEEQNAEGQAVFNRQLTLEPNVINFLAFQPSDILSLSGNIRSYRLRLNNEDLTNEDVHCVGTGGVKNQADGLYYDRLVMTMANAGINVKNLLEVGRRTDKNTGGYGDQFVNDIVTISNPIPASNDNQLLQVNIQGEPGTTLGKLCFFKNVLKQI
tara:strand:- start:4894 stop:6498 length:1605 start_codon:yes stop_codon:yes gene_type:complete